MKVANDVTDLIGGTPLLRLHKLSGPESANVLVKLEWFSIGGSERSDGKVPYRVR
jgi:cysteine synthase A